METTRQFDTGRITFTFTDTDGHVFASCRMNPTDVGLMARAEEVSAYFAERKISASDIVGSAELKAYNDEIEEKLNYLLGYDASSDLFGEITATTISPDGEMFALIVLDMISEKLAPEFEKRRRNMLARVNEYTAEYDDGE